MAGSANDLESEIEQLVKETIPGLLAELGVGSVSAAQLTYSMPTSAIACARAFFADLPCGDLPAITDVGRRFRGGRAKST